MEDRLSQNHLQARDDDDEARARYFARRAKWLREQRQRPKPRGADYCARRAEAAHRDALETAERDARRAAHKYQMAKLYAEYRERAARSAKAQAVRTKLNSPERIAARRAMLGASGP
jgi:hypothetical protein